MNKENHDRAASQDTADPSPDETSNQFNDEDSLNVYEELSAYLFVSPKPVSVEKLSEFTGLTEDEVKTRIESLNEGMRYANLGFEIIEIQDSFQMRTKESVKSSLQKLITPRMKRLSKAAAETLAVIAYKQPVSKAEIEVIRGVDPLPTIKTLLDGKLIRIVGREDTPGSPALYGTTEHFLERFGLRALSELPTVREIDMLNEEAEPAEDIQDLLMDEEISGSGEPGAESEELSQEDTTNEPVSIH
jgi:segregation and condensation protein B